MRIKTSKKKKAYKAQKAHGQIKNTAFLCPQSV